jgi:alanine racemase
MIRKTAKRLLRRLAANDYRTLNRIELDGRRMLANVAHIQKLHPQQAVIAVLKANAYGHGLLQTAEILNNAECAFLAVDGYFEAARIKDIPRHHILVMGYSKPENVKLFDLKRCSFVVQDIAGLRAFASLNRPVRIHMELDTGMHRLGLAPDEVTGYLQVFKQYPQLQLEGVMTHLADADNPKTDAYTQKQVQLFDRIVERVLAHGFQPRFFHIAQTAGSTKAHSRYANAIRLGIGLYGINPLQPSDGHFSDLNGLRPVLTLKSTIIKTYDLKKGDRVSYNGLFTAPAATRIGILPLGYYEGLPRELSNRGTVSFDHQQLPILGTVCMNHTTIDITATKLGVGDEVTVISNDPAAGNSVLANCAAYNLFSYDLLVGLSDTIKRVVV